MLLYAPITKADYLLAAPLFRWMKLLGGIGDHPMVLAISQIGIPAIEEEILTREALALGPKVFVVPMDQHPEFGWPRSANLIFQEAALYAQTNGAHGQNCWYFFELDNTPLHEGWLDDLQEEYNYRERPCMGAINETRRGVNTDGSHMVGTGIYPPDYFSRAGICRHLHILGDPFDVALQTQTVPMTWNTRLIQHNWSTCSYQWDSRYKRFTCEASSSRPAAERYAKTVSFGSRGPLVVHGCKDSSLITALKKAIKEKPQPAKEDVND